jgi:hypothetical protein
MIAPYRPNINAKVMDLPAVIPLAAGVVDCQVVPFEVRTLPAVLGATVCKPEVPFPNKTPFVERLVVPVPPLATGSVPVT